MLPPNWQADFAESLLSDHPIAEGASSMACLKLYQNNRLHSLTTALKRHYPLVANLLGNDFFTITAKAYIEQYPPTSHFLHEYGEYFCAFLIEYEPVQHLIYLPEIADFEWATHRVSLAAAADAMSLDEANRLLSLDPKRLTLTLHPAACLIKCHYPILKIIQWCKNGVTADLNLTEGGTTLLIHRPKDEIQLTTVSADDFIFFDRLQEGYTLSTAIHQTKLVNPFYPHETKLQEAIEQALIVDISVQDDALTT